MRETEEIEPTEVIDLIRAAEILTDLGEEVEDLDMIEETIKASNMLLFKQGELEPAKA